MPRPPAQALTERESQIMRLLWKQGALTSEEIRSRLPGQPHDSSVRTILRVLVRKGYVHRDPDSRPAAYSAAVPEANAQNKAARSLLQRFFSGSALELVQHLIDHEQLTPEQLAKLRRQFRSPKRNDE